MTFYTPNNLHIVCVCVCKSSKSLNACLHRGPNLISNLCGVLLRFRMHKVAFVSDIKKAYLQLQLNPLDRDVTRFLWVHDVDKEITDENIRELRFCRVIWGIVSAAFLLAYTIFYHLEKYNSAVSRDIGRNLYVDNLNIIMKQREYSKMQVWICVSGVVMIKT